MSTQVTGDFERGFAVVGAELRAGEAGARLGFIPGT